MHVLLTGVSGFLGRRLAGHLVARGLQVSGTYFEASPPVVPGVVLSPLDVADERAVRDLIAARSPDVVVHLAGLSHVGESWTRVAEYYRANLLGSEHVILAARRVGARAILPSSAEVYGRVPDAEQPIREERPLAPGTPYALTKAAAERIVLPAGGIVVRCFNLVGPGQAPRFALPAFAGQLAEIHSGRREAELRVGNLDARRDFVHVDDACTAFSLLLERGMPGEVYNLASGEAVSLREALARLCRLAGVEPTLVVDSSRLRPLDVPLLYGDAGRLHALGWRVERGLDRALADLWATVLADAGGERP